MFIKKIDTYKKFDELKAQVLELTDTVMEKNHVSLQYNKEIGDVSWSNSNGWDLTRKEQDYNTVLPILEGTPIDEFFQYFTNKYNEQLVRTRILAIDSMKVGYYVHHDWTPRIHIPIITDPGARFYSYSVAENDEFNVSTKYGKYDPRSEQQCEFMEADGSIYYADTTTKHTFKNFSNVKRIHIIASIYGDQTKWR